VISFLTKTNKGENDMSIYDDLTQSGQLAKGDYLTILESVEMKVSKAGNEYIALKFRTKEKETIYHNLHFSEKAIGMSIKQLKSLKLLASLPIYASLKDLDADKANFVRKVMELLMQIEKKKITISITGYDENDRPKTWIKSYDDVMNAAIQKDIPSQSNQKSFSKTPSMDEEIPF
jgi:hypothetical protein